MWVCMLCSTIDLSDFPWPYIWNCANVGILHAQIAALNLVLKSSNTRQNQKPTFSVKLTRIPWMFNKIFYFFKKYKWSPIFNWKNSFDPYFLSKKKYLIPPISRYPPPGKNDTSLSKKLEIWLILEFFFIHCKTVKVSQNDQIRM